MKIQKILVPFDFSPHSEKALRWAAGLAEKWEARIQLFHAVQPPTYPPMMAGLMDPTQFEASLRDDADRRLRDIAAREKKVRIETEVRLGEPFHEICWTAQESRLYL